MELNGKIISFLGDSITEGNGVTDIENCRYDNRLKKQFCIKEVHNYGVGGTRLARQTSRSEVPVFDEDFCKRAEHLNTNSDIIVVFGGTNDYSTGDAPFGEMTDDTPSTFCGAVEHLMNALSSKYPKATPVFITPARRAGDEFVSASPVKHHTSKPLKAYVDVIIQKAKAHGFAVLNMYEKLPINPNLDADKVKYTTDGLHFNNDGHEVLAAVIGEFLQSL